MVVDVAGPYRRADPADAAATGRVRDALQGTRVRCAARARTTRLEDSLPSVPPRRRPPDGRQPRHARGMNLDPHWAPVGLDGVAEPTQDLEDARLLLRAAQDVKIAVFTRLPTDERIDAPAARDPHWAASRGDRGEHSVQLVECIRDLVWTCPDQIVPFRRRSVCGTCCSTAVVGISISGSQAVCRMASGVIAGVWPSVADSGVARPELRPAVVLLGAGADGVPGC